MGIPKFFRWISERYPLTSQLIEENKIPEFDNLYLDFNAIIHNCSHPNDGDAHFRMTDAQIYTAIFGYVDHLFGKIKPKKVFFMAVDGVAPRAKMNQQRSRRFRTAKEARELREGAEARGEKLPDQKAFDSNCITPGTDFMVKVSEQLRYFVNKKISEDSDWRDVQVILSGHDVPGEGEHKIMEYIRLSKAQPDYNPNVRHCMYGLDADLIMLGLMSHDPHFCLLREEVKFGPSKKKNSSLESQNFYLLHLSLFREYLDLEFHSLLELAPGELTFEYSLERIIDDFILLAIFVGNDFLPHLPDFHINENALERLFEIYKEVLPRAGGYLVTQGTIDMRRLQLVLDELAKGELETFTREHADTNYFRGKQAKYRETNAAEARAVMTPEQQDIFRKVRALILEGRKVKDRPSTANPGKISIINDFPARDRTFLVELVSDLHLSLTWDEYDEEDRNLVSIYLPEHDADDVSSSEDEEAIAAVDRVLKKYDHVSVVKRPDEDEFDALEDAKQQKQLKEWKDQYYRGKLDFSHNQPEQVQRLVYRYCEGLQWVLYYYYGGVASWSWYYDYHYSPRISDMTGADKFEFNFVLGEPFKPYEQLMGVLPEASRELVPIAFQSLMYNSESPIIDFYPKQFEQDLNGKKNDWEAVVKIPFIDENRLRKAMSDRAHKLSDEERRRNAIGTSTLFVFTPNEVPPYPSSLPGVFPAIARCHCLMQTFNLPTLDGLHLVEGLCDGVFLGVEALAGFPSIKTLRLMATLGYHGVSVFQSASRNKSMVLNIRDEWENRKTTDICHELLGQRVFIHWPFLQEAKLVAISDDMFRYEHGSTPHSPQQLQQWKRKADKIEETYSKRFAVLSGPVNRMIHVLPLKGLRRLETGALVKEYETVDKEVEMALQMTVMHVISEDPRYIEKTAAPLSDEYPEGTNVIFLGEHAYGVAARVSDTTETALTVILAFFPAERTEVDTLLSILATSASSERYYPSYKVADSFHLSGLTLARVTSNLMVTLSSGQKINIGLKLKFEAKGLKVSGYSRKNGRTWEFSDRAVKLLSEYRNEFPGMFAALDQRKDDTPTAASLFPGDDADTRMRKVDEWLKQHGVRDFEPVELMHDQLSKEMIAKIESYGESINGNRNATAIKKALVKGIPPNAVLKPAHAAYRLRNQVFSLGDRVCMAQDAGSVPLCAKGVVVGLKTDAIEVVWDAAFMSGTSLGDRCSQYRGSTVSVEACLNLTRRQFVAPTGKSTATPTPFAPQTQARNAWASRGGPPRMEPGPPIRIMSNPNRGRATNGGTSLDRMSETQGSPNAPQATALPSNARGQAHQRNFPSSRGFGGAAPNARGLGRTTNGSSPDIAAAHPARGRGAGSIPSRGMDRGRRPFGGRGRGRGSQSPRQADGVAPSSIAY